MRLEKAYRAFGRELTPDYNPVEGRAAVRVQAQDRHLVPGPGGGSRRPGPRGPAGGWSSLVLHDPGANDLGAAKLVLRDGGRGRPGGPRAPGGEALGACVGLGLHPPPRRGRAHAPNVARAGRYAVSIGGRLYPATVHLRPAVRPGRRPGQARRGYLGGGPTYGAGSTAGPMDAQSASQSLRPAAIQQPPDNAGQAEQDDPQGQRGQHLRADHSPGQLGTDQRAGPVTRPGSCPPRSAPYGRPCCPLAPKTSPDCGCPRGPSQTGRHRDGGSARQAGLRRCAPAGAAASRTAGRLVAMTAEHAVRGQASLMHPPPEAGPG